jgi:DNA-binding transcriptional ArsR family regulator
MDRERADLTNVDRTIHEPVRLAIVSLLACTETVDFLFLQTELGLTKGNLSSHLSKLEKTEYVEIEKTYRGKRPLTLCRLTDRGREAYDDYCETVSTFFENDSKRRREREDGSDE